MKDHHVECRFRPTKLVGCVVEKERDAAFRAGDSRGNGRRILCYHDALSPRKGGLRRRDEFWAEISGYQAIDPQVKGKVVTSGNIGPAQAGIMLNN